MRRCILLLGLFCFFPAPLVAQEPEWPHLELLQGLREREYFDLALEYIRRLEKLKLPPDIAAMLPLETARARLGLAMQARHGTERDVKVKAAQADLEQFIERNPRHPNLVDARAELAHVLYQQARFLLFQAQLRSDRGQTEEADQLVEQAVPLLDRAEQLYAQALPLLRQRAAAPLRNQSLRARADKRRDLESYLYALWYEAQTLHAIARRPGAEDRVAANSLFKANELLTELAKVRDQHPLGWAAIAFAGKCYEGVDDVKSADAYRRVLAERHPRAHLGQELTRYYRMQNGWTAFRQGSREGGKFVRTEAEAWLKAFPGSARSRHGQHIRYMLALVLAADYQALDEQRRQAPQHRETIERATRTLEDLEKGTGDIAWAAELMMLPVMQLFGHSTGPIENLKTFKECLLRADSTWTTLAQTSQLLSQAKEEEKEGLRKQVAQLATELLAAARRALRLMPPNVKDSDWDLTYQMLIVGHLRTGDMQRAAVLSDYLAHHARQTNTGLRATVEAMKIYQYLARAQDAVARQRVVALADRMQKEFPEASQTDEAREVLGLDFLMQEKFAEAAAVLAQVTPKHPGYALCRLRAGSACWTLHVLKMRQEKKPLRTASPDLAKAISLLEQSVNAFATSKSPADAQYAISAQLLLGEIYGQQGETDKMLAVLSPLLGKVEAKQLPAEIADEIEPRVLGLALRGYVEKKDFQRGVMRVFGILKSKGTQGGNYGRLLRNLGGQLRGQLHELQQAGPAAANERLALQEGFRQLLQTIEGNPQQLAELRSWVADCYADLGDFRKAMDLYLAVPQRQPPEEMQLLRLVRQAWESAVIAQKPQWLTQWEQHLNRIASQTWAGRNPYFIQESLLLLEAQGKISGPAGALKRWYDFRSMLKTYADPNNPKSTPALRELYQASNYHFVNCLAQEARLLPAGPEQDAALARAATEFLQARRANFGAPEFPEFKSKYEQLLQSQPALKAKVVELSR